MFERPIKIGLGDARNNNGSKKISVSLDDLLRHQYVIGATGSGKSTLIINEVLDAFRQGLCTWILDPHGDLALDLVEATYPEDLDSVLIFDPLKVGFSLNPFELPRYEGREQRSMMVERMVGEIVGFMKRMYGERYWGPSLNRIFQNALRTLYEKDDAPTFEEMLNLIKERLDEEDFEDFYGELDALPKGRTDAVINKLEPFVRNEMLRKIFCQKVSTIDVEELLGPKLVVWRLPKGELSEMNAGLIGSALVTKLWLSIVSRERSSRPPLFLAIDEFQNFAHLETLGDLVTEGRKYGIGLLLAHQHTKQVPEKLLADVLGNTATKTVFRVSEHDARVVGNSLGCGDKNRLMSVLTSLPDGRAVVQLRSGFGERPAVPFEIYTPKPPAKMHSFTEKLLARMRERYEAPILPQQPSFKPEVDAELLDVLKNVYVLKEEGLETTRTNIAKRISISGTELSALLDKAQSMGLVERTVKKEGRGRPKVLTELTEKGLQAIGVGISSGSSTKAGGELHRALLFKVKEWLDGQGYNTVIPEQGGPGEQPDMLAYPKDGGREIAVEVETSANHPEQVIKSYEKNVKLERFVIFVVLDEKVENRVKSILEKVGKKFRIFRFN
ncbi:MAG: type IV secretion system DNA-binding domain-containing protein [Candidatus Thermoplasmatota archaeon]|nr:type IV secretion system DNA-binding domain-containing protein [Candidatus Thermoplasmatota archaeon]